MDHFTIQATKRNIVQLCTTEGYALSPDYDNGDVDDDDDDDNDDGYDNDYDDDDNDDDAAQGYAQSADPRRREVAVRRREVTTNVRPNTNNNYQRQKLPIAKKIAKAKIGRK